MIEANSPPTQPPAQDTWDGLLKQTELFAAGQAAVRWWRHAHDGVMPDGYDPTSIAAQAVTDLLQKRRVNKDESLTEDQIRHIQSKLQRLVCQIVDRLRHRKESSLVCNEPDMSPVPSTTSKSGLGANGPSLSIIKLALNPPICAKSHKNISLFTKYLHSFSKKSLRQMAQNAFSPP